MKQTAIVLLLSFITTAGLAQVFTKNTDAKPDSMMRLPILHNLNMAYPVPPDYYTTGFGFFCKQELKMEKVKVPLKLRVGNPDHCDYLESKTKGLFIDK